MKWPAPILIILYGSLYWELNHWLHAAYGVSYQQILKKVSYPRVVAKGESIKGISIPGERPKDKYMGIATFALLLPLLAFTAIFPDRFVLLTASYAIWPIIVTIILGVWRGRHSVSAAMFLSTQGGIISVFFHTDILLTIKSCIDNALVLEPSQKIEALKSCLATTQFWFNAWITVAAAVTAIFMGALIAGVFALPLENWGWEARKEERQILATLYVVAMVVLLVESFWFVGLPCFHYMREITDLLRAAQSK